LPHCFSFVVLHHNRMIHIFSALLNCNERSFTNQILTAWTTLYNTMFRYLVLGQYSKFQVVHMPDISIVSQFCTYMNFWPGIVKYGNINLHMQMEVIKKEVLKIYFSTQNTLFLWLFVQKFMPVHQFLDYVHIRSITCCHIVLVLLCCTITGWFTYFQLF
jgi:hypothetical protein